MVFPAVPVQVRPERSFPKFFSTSERRSLAFSMGCPWVLSYFEKRIFFFFVHYYNLCCPRPNIKPYIEHSPTLLHEMFLFYFKS
jgi:hypothetical protein